MRWIVSLTITLAILSCAERDTTEWYGNWNFIPEDQSVNILTYQSGLEVLDQEIILTIACDEFGVHAGMHSDIPSDFDNVLHPVTIEFDNDEPIKQQWNYHQFFVDSGYYKTSIVANHASSFVSRLLNAEKVSVHFAGKDGRMVVATWSDVRGFDDAYEALQQECGLAGSVEEESSGQFGEWVFLPDEQLLDIGTLVPHPDLNVQEQWTVLTIACTADGDSVAVHSDVPLAFTGFQLNPVTIEFDDDEHIVEKWEYNQYPQSPDSYDSLVFAPDPSPFISRLMTAERVTVHFYDKHETLVAATFSDVRGFDAAYEALQQECATAKIGGDQDADEADNS